MRPRAALRRYGWIAVYIFAPLAGATLAPGEQFTSPLGLPLLETTIAQVQARFGPAPITAEGHDQDVVCYLWPDQTAAIRFSVGREGLDSSFEMRSVGNRVLRSKCPEIPRDRVGGLVLAVGGLRLGMTGAEFAAALGLPAGATGVTFSREEPARRQDGSLDPENVIYTSVQLAARFEKDRMIELTVSKDAST
jgi:hypothetical protein